MNSALIFKQSYVDLTLRFPVEVRALDIPYSHRESLASDAYLPLNHNRP